MRERESYRELILENIEYDCLIQNHRLDRDRLDELVELMVDTVCSNAEMIRIAGDDYPAEVVKSRFLKLNSSHIEYVLDRMRENTTYVRNIKKYLLAALYNAPATIDSYYTSLVSHDMYGGGDRRVMCVQEEITQGVVSLSVETGKMTADLLQKAVKKVLEEMQKKPSQRSLHQGKQTLHQLKQHGASLTNIEITEQNIKAFSAVAKKYDIDYALKKDPTTDPPHYYVFFKAKDKDQLQPAFKEFTAMTLGRENRPTIRERLAQAQEQSKTKHREREKVKTKDREVAR